MSKIRVRFGGSHRLYGRQVRAFHEAGILLEDCGSFTLGRKARCGLMPDSVEARALLARMGGSVARKQWAFLKHEEEEA